MGRAKPQGALQHILLAIERVDSERLQMLNLPVIQDIGTHQAFSRPVQGSNVLLLEIFPEV